VKIAIINQPLENRGDESAHRALIRALVAQYPAAEITVLFIGENTASVAQFRVDAPNVTYHTVAMRYARSRLPAWALLLHLRWLVALVHPSYQKYRQAINDADYVINAPGGICMGGFQNWQHIFCLLLAQACGKPIAYYSRSFGPFLENRYKDRLFKRLSVALLRNFDFLSIRDSKTMALADRLGLSYTKSIDTAFLERPREKMPLELADELGNTDYVVFVPNSLVWHVSYRQASPESINKLYLTIIEKLRARYPTQKIVMLPQLFNAGHNSDYLYFKELKTRSKYGEDVIVVPDCYSSDIQQVIIARAKLVVGARYHSIIFAINNNIPFVALSYEHKIAGMLETLDLPERGLDISGIANVDFDIVMVLRAFDRLLDTLREPIAAGVKAGEIACGCFQQLLAKLNSLESK